MTKMKLLLGAALLALALASTTAPTEAVCYPSCDTYCVGKTSGTICGCPKWTDRPCIKTTCGTWQNVGSCWYG